MLNGFWSDLLSQATGGVIGGALGGSAVLFIQRFLSRFGKIEASVKQRNVVFQNTTGDTSQPLVDRSSANEVLYAFTVRFFNNKPSNNGLRDITVRFERDGVVKVSHPPYDPTKPIF